MAQFLHCPIGLDDATRVPLDLPVGFCSRRKQRKPRRLNDYTTSSHEHPMPIYKANSATNRIQKSGKAEEKDKHLDCLAMQRSVRTRKMNKRYLPEVDFEKKKGKRKRICNAASEGKKGQLLLSLKRDKTTKEAQVRYAVEDVLAISVEGAARTFLIRWEGYGPEGDTWESESGVGHLEIVKDAIRQVEEEKTKKAVRMAEGQKTVFYTSDRKNSPTVQKRHFTPRGIADSGVAGRPGPNLTWNGSGIIKGNWTEAEDQRLTHLVTQFVKVHPGMAMTRWADIAKELPGRVGKQCRERWNNHLQPDVNKGSWTLMEEVMIYLCWCSWSNQWARMARVLHGRTDNRIKNHWNCHMKRHLMGNSSYFHFMEDCHKNLSGHINDHPSRDDDSKDNLLGDTLLVAIGQFLAEHKDQLEHLLFLSSLKGYKRNIPEESRVQQLEGTWILRQMQHKEQLSKAASWPVSSGETC